ncbi:MULTISPECIES: Tox-REase-5 domain-containing protein [Actinomyces]|uniref:Tox-REase-5 domain-containing protein n=1 Tax=Actinomyces respiraculi TaxID=2744574 RepID=A0A7T0LLG8_9ACTO|nr:MULTISPECIES: Tox-REase-5 domain-containing protein [Actinomyces]QPL05636.1 hypothetical protein ID810_01165 [Actinomyces respiraculi]
MRVQDSYHVDGIEFDGWDGTTLIEAKGPRWDALLNEDWATRARDEIVEQAHRQITAVRNTRPGTPIQWHFADDGALEYVRNLQRQGLFPADIDLIFTPNA